MDGDFFIGAALATTLTKLSLHFSEIVLKSDPKGQAKVNFLTTYIFFNYVQFHEKEKDNIFSFDIFTGQQICWRIYADFGFGFTSWPIRIGT